VEARKRAFPESEKAADVIAFFRALLKEGGVRVKLGSPVERIVRAGGRIESVEAGGASYSAESYVLATGGLSRPETGSTGDGFRWLRDLGHAVSKPTPTIVPLKAEEAWVKDLAGISIPYAKVSFFFDAGAAEGNEPKRKFSVEGPVLFTHFGLSGPTILNAAGKVQDLLYGGRVIAKVDLAPGKDLATLDRALTALFDANKNKALKNVFKEFAPAGMSDTLLSLAWAAPDAKVHSVTREERRRLLDVTKALPLTITGLMGFEKAVVADGGVALEELDMRTMRSARVENLFIVGDLLDITRPSGGYSLQLCWTTGYVAGSNA
jgi:predicted Rossmann fold flavoprotein